MWTDSKVSLGAVEPVHHHHPGAAVMLLELWAEGLIQGALERFEGEARVEHVKADGECHVGQVVLGMRDSCEIGMSERFSMSSVC
jgi:hypothetical protein